MIQTPTESQPAPATPVFGRIVMTVTQGSQMGTTSHAQRYNVDSQEELNELMNHAAEAHSEPEDGFVVQWEQNNGYYGYIILIGSATSGDHVLISAYPCVRLGGD